MPMLIFAQLYNSKEKYGGIREHHEKTYEAILPRHLVRLENRKKKRLLSSLLVTSFAHRDDTHAKRVYTRAVIGMRGAFAFARSQLSKSILSV